jgi:diguanylate cyclase (GGDEF)-like protein
MIIFAALYMISALIYLYMGIFTISNDPKNIINRTYFAICCIMFAWAAVSVLVIASPDAYTATVFRRYATFAWSLLYSVLLQYFIYLTGRSIYFKKPLSVFLIYLPAVYSIYLYFFQKPEAASSMIKTPLGWAYSSLAHQGLVWDYYLTVYYLSYMFLCVVLLWTWGRKSVIRREIRQAKIMITTIIIAVVLGSFTDVIMPKTNMILMPPTAVILCLIPIGGIWYSMKKYRLMNLNYESLTLDILKVIDEGLIILDHKGVIVDANTGALHLLVYKDKSELAGKRLDVIFPSDMAGLSSIRSFNNRETELMTSEGTNIPVLLQYLTLYDQLGDDLGSLISFQDISEIKGVQRDLEAARDNLEYMVFERTNELTKTNNDLENEISARKIVEEKIKKIAFFDSLTGLPNRRLFDDRLEQAILKADRHHNCLALLYLDVDSFKHVNDTLGHVKGDKLLVEIAKRLRSCLRKTDTIARVGGDEFLIIMDEMKDITYVQKVSEKILLCFKSSFVIGQQELNITVSIGISIYPDDGPDFETLVKNADAAMYKSKENGKNKIEFCTAALKEKLTERIRLTNSLYHALDRNEMELYYQPQVDSSTNTITGVEALLRWHHPDLGFVGPSVFIPIAETSGLIIPIGEWVINQACRQNKLWQDMGFARIPIAVNVSVKQFSNDLVVKNVRQILQETGLDPEFLELEITENIVMRDFETISKILNELKSMGVRLAIDDFGTEYASLNYLKELPIDRVKIAMSFIRGLNVNKKDETITQAIILLAQNLNMAVIAEGVEKKEQLDFLKNSMCDMIQGYYYYKPMPKEEFEKLLQLNLIVVGERYN